MKKLFILAVAITSSLLFVQCKKTETLIPQEEVVTTVKSLTSIDFQGTSWKVVALVSTAKNINLRWDSRSPKLIFHDTYIEMKLGLDLCGKRYQVNPANILTVEAVPNCSISNPNYLLLTDMFNGDFEYQWSATNADELVLKNIANTEITLKRLNELATTGHTSSLTVE
jgi:hypothetical protein